MQSWMGFVHVILQNGWRPLGLQESNTVCNNVKGEQRGGSGNDPLYVPCVRVLRASGGQDVCGGIVLPFMPGNNCGWRSGGGIVEQDGCILGKSSSRPRPRYDSASDTGILV